MLPVTKLATVKGLTKTEFIKCPLRIVISDLFMFECDIFKRKFGCNKLNISFCQYRCNSEFSVFLAFELRFIILFWDNLRSVGSSLSTSLLICVWQTKFIQYCWMLLNSKKSLKCKMITLKCFSKMAKRELKDARPSNAQCLKIAMLEGDVTPPRGWKYPTPPCALAKTLPETTVRA